MAIADLPTTQAQHNGQATFIPVKNPISGEVFDQVPLTTPEGVAAAVARARQAQPAWEALGVRERRKRLRKWADLLWERQKEAMQVIRRETGKAENGAYLELLVTDNLVTYYYHNAPRLLKPKRVPTLFPGVQRAKIVYKAHGVVGIISPWNYPFLLPFMDSIPALFAGNVVVYKPSEVTPFSVQYGVDLMHEAGIPRDVVQVVHGDGSTGKALVDHVDFIAFTGSTATGRKVAQQAAARLIPFTVELGGKDPSIVLKDADVDMTATGLMRGAFENAGQVCISVERVYVEAPIYDKLIERMLHYAPQFNLSNRSGFDVHMGSMTNTRELERTEAHIADAVQKGARVLFGGKRRPDLGPLFFEPTILVDVDHSMDIMREETFGPVLPIMKVDSVEEAIRLANDSDYGLSASIFSKDLARAEKIAERIESGDVSINRTQMCTATPALPTGGEKNSGIGRRNGESGLMKYVKTQSILADNLFAQKPELTVADPLTLKLVVLLRAVRRHIPFI